MSTKRLPEKNRRVYFPLAVNLRPLTEPTPPEKLPVVVPVMVPPAGAEMTPTVIGPVKLLAVAPVASVAVRLKLVAPLAGTNVEATMFRVRAVMITGLEMMNGRPAAETLKV